MSDDPAAPLAEDPRGRSHRLPEEAEEEPSSEKTEALPGQQASSSGAAGPLDAPQVDVERPAGQDVAPTRPVLSEEDTAPLRVHPSPPPPLLFAGKTHPKQPESLPTVQGVNPRRPVRSGQQAADLPRRVNQVDTGATRVSSAAYSPPRSSRRPPSTSSRQTYTGARSIPSTSQQEPKVLHAARPSVDYNRRLGCLLRMMFASIFLVVLMALCGFSAVFYQYYRIAATLPSISDLRQARLAV